MDLKKLIAKSKLPQPSDPVLTNKRTESKKTEETPQPVAISARCICGHPEDAHDGECTILECECGRYEPTSIASPAPITLAVPKAPSIAENDLEAFIPKEFQGLTIDQEIEKLRAENESNRSGEASSIVEVSEDGCQHICQPSIPNSKGPQGCGEWWSHGHRLKCRHPEILNLGLCPKCMGKGQEPFNPLEDFDTEKMKLTPQGIMRSENKARIECVDMNIEQLTHHIEFLAKCIEQLKAESMGTRKLRTEKEEEALLNIPAAEREKFIQSLRQGKDSKTPRVRKAKAIDAEADKGVRLSKYERNVRNLMVTLGKTRQEVEKFLA